MESAIQNALGKLGYTDLRPNQRQVIENYLGGKDVLFCSPTGSGKSLTFEAAPFIYKYLSGDDQSCVIVVSPLTSLMKTQVKALQSKGVKAVYLRDMQQSSIHNDDSLNQVDSGLKNLSIEDQKIDQNMDIIFSSPESLIGKYRDLVMKLARKGQIKIIFVDEAHCIKKFGKASDKKKAPYRPCYGRLGELRSLAGPTVPVVALTATATVETRQTIIKDLCMDKHFELLVDPNKKNIKYWVQDVTDDKISHSFEWLVTLLRTKAEKTPRMIVFFRQIKHISEVYEHLETSLGQHAFVNYNVCTPNDDRNRLFEMFHLKTDEIVKESICESYQDPSGNVRVVLCSTSFSMGLDVKGVDNIVHYGPANDLDDYLQETGRAGRDQQQQCHAILIKYKRCLGSKNIRKEMKEYIKTKQCRRKTLLNPFISAAESTIPLHNCCDICSRMCKCLCTCSEECICTVTCNESQSDIIQQIQLQSDLNLCTLTDSSSSNEDDFESDSSFEEHMSRKPQVLQFSSDDDSIQDS